MTATGAEYRLDGIYRQRQEGFFMQRVKLPAGVISTAQARVVCRAADCFGRGRIHLTTRGSMELHWLKEPDLTAVKRLLASVGLTSRGACGGAVRGVSCTGQGAAGFPQLEALARRLQRHFTGNPRFERLPKKFKIGLEADAGGKRHLIQDVGLVPARCEDGRACYDVWIAGGLGREPRPGFLLAADVAEERIIPLIEAVMRVYAARTPAGKRLKHLLREIGEEELVRLINADPSAAEELPAYGGLAENLVATAGDPGRRVEARIFAGDLSSRELASLADFADLRAGGALMVTPDQNIAFELAPGMDPEAARGALEQAGFAGASRQERVNFRICPGSHECRMGLAPTRDAARSILATMGSLAGSLSWAISGCPNSCSQPQLADAGVVASRLVAGDDGRRTPRFDLYRLEGEGLGERVEEGLTMEELLEAVRRIG